MRFNEIIFLSPCASLEHQTSENSHEPHEIHCIHDLKEGAEIINKTAL